MNTNDLNPQAFRRAAERLASFENNSCCFALDAELSISETDRYMRFMRAEFGITKDVLKSGFWWVDDDGYNAREARIVALLLCAEMCKSA